MQNGGAGGTIRRRMSREDVRAAGRPQSFGPATRSEALKNNNFADAVAIRGGE
jgi:hypothetical protein